MKFNPFTRKKKEEESQDLVLYAVESNMLDRASGELTPEEEADILRKKKQIKELKAPHKPETEYEKKQRLNWNTILPPTILAVATVTVKLLDIYQEQVMNSLSKTPQLVGSLINKMKFW